MSASVAPDNINRIQVGERIRFISHESMLEVRMNAVRRYPSIVALLDRELWEKIAPLQQK